MYKIKRVSHAWAIVPSERNIFIMWLKVVLVNRSNVEQLFFLVFYIRFYIEFVSKGLIDRKKYLAVERSNCSQLVIFSPEHFAMIF